MYTVQAPPVRHYISHVTRQIVDWQCKQWEHMQLVKSIAPPSSIKNTPLKQNAKRELEPLNDILWTKGCRDFRPLQCGKLTSESGAVQMQMLWYWLVTEQWISQCLSVKFTCPTTLSHNACSVYSRLVQVGQLSGVSKCMYKNIGNVGMI